MQQQLRGATWWAGIYPLMIAVLVGLGWMDGSWHQGLQGRVPDTVLNGASRSVADMLLWLLAMVLFAGAIAAWLWGGAARLFCVASIAVLCLEFVLPAVFNALPGGGASLENAGLLLRTGIHLVALALAVMALRKAVA